jgi:hypothetical protein
LEQERIIQELHALYDIVYLSIGDGLLWVLLVLLLAKQRVQCSAKIGEILQLDGFYFIQHRTIRGYRASSDE